jgi:hypothetical protein
MSPPAMARRTLEQSHYGLRKKRFTLLEDGLLCEEQNIFLSRQEHKIPYEAIPRDMFEARVSSRIAFGFLAAILGLGVLTFIVTFLDPHSDKMTPLAYLIAAVPFAATFLLSRKHFVGYHCFGKTVLFYKDKPTAGELEAFIAALQHLRNQRLKLYFTNMKAANPTDELEKLVWLRNQGTITEEEFQTLKRSLIKRSKSESSPDDSFGFSAN